MNKWRINSLFIMAMLIGGQAHASVFQVFAQANSSSGTGVGLDTVALTSGQSFSVSVNPLDLWSAGALPRWSNANGLQGILNATGAVDSNGDNPGVVAGTQIGANFGTWTQANLSAAYGSLVGQIGSGNYFLIGTSYSGIANASGTLKLYYWDSNNSDNAGSINANVSAVPLPAALWLFTSAIAGFSLLRRK